MLLATKCNLTDTRTKSSIGKMRMRTIRDKTKYARQVQQQGWYRKKADVFGERKLGFRTKSNRNSIK